MITFILVMWGLLIDYFYIIFRSLTLDWVLFSSAKDTGSAENIRLIFIEAGVPFKEHKTKMEDLPRLAKKLNQKLFPHTGLPVLVKGLRSLLFGGSIKGT